MSAHLIPTGLDLDQDGSVAPGTIVVPGLGGSAGLVTSEPMVFRADGPHSTGREMQLVAQVNPAWASAVVAPATWPLLSSALGVPVMARRLTKPERLGLYGKAEVALTVVALLLAISAIFAAIVTPSADKGEGRSQAAAQLAPIEQHLADALRTNDLTAVHQVDTQLHAALVADDHPKSGISTAVTVLTLLLGVLSALIAFGVASKRARATP